MGRLYEECLDGRVYVCRCCNGHLARHDDIISKQFHSRNGRAYLFHTVVNVSCGPSEDRRMVTGLHTVCDIYCRTCMAYVGWKYDFAYEKSQKYKEGKFILERDRMEDAGVLRHGTRDPALAVANNALSLMNESESD